MRDWEDTPKGGGAGSTQAGALHLLLSFPASCSVGCPGLLQWDPALFLLNLFSWILHHVTLNLTTVPSVCDSFFSSLFPRFLLSFRQHRTAITGLTFSPDGNLMFSCCLQGTLALYRFVAQKTQVLRVLGKTVGLPFFFYCISTDILTPEPTQTQPAWSDISQ